MNAPLYRLLTNAPFRLSPHAISDFELALREEVNFQTLNSSHYKHFLKLNGWNIGDALGDLPYLPVGAFKHQSQQTRIQNLDGFNLSSSGTSGATSSIFVDVESSKRQKLSLFQTMNDIFGSDKRQVIVVDVDPRNLEEGSARQAAIMGYARNSSSIHYLIDSSKNSQKLPKVPTLDLNPNQPALVIGFTFMIWQFIRANLDGNQLLLPPGSQVLHIGGWKRLEEQKVSTAEFNRVVGDFFGLPKGQVRNAYGFTELMGVSFIECEQGKMHVPSWVRVAAISPSTMSQVGESESGLLGFRSPLPHSYLGLSLLTDDIGTVSRIDSICECGREGQTLSVLGRRKKAEIRGCGNILGAQETRKIERGQHDLSVNFLFPFEAEADAVAIREAIEKARLAAKSLADFPTSQKLALVESLRRAWSDLANSDESGQLRANGLGFLLEWAMADNLRNTLDSSLPAGRASLDGWTERVPGKDNFIRLLPRGLVSQWVSGNVPALGIFPVIYAWLTGNASVSRLSLQAQDLMVALLEPLKHLSVREPLAKHFLQSTVLVTFDRTNLDANSVMSSEADTLIAWGGEEAIASISKYPVKRDVRKLLFGPSSSMAVVFGSQLLTPAKIRVVARRLVADISVFDQAACASPHTLVVVTSEPDQIADLKAEIVRQFFSAANLNSSVGTIDPELSDELNLYRLRRNLDAEVTIIGNYATVVSSESLTELPQPAFGRTIHISSVSSVGELSNLANPHLQTVSVMGSPVEMKGVAGVLAPMGAKRFPILGKATNFENPWDSQDLIGAMVRPVTLGGP